MTTALSIFLQINCLLLPSGSVAETKKIRMTIGKNAFGFHFSFYGQTIFVEVDGNQVEHDWFALEDMFSGDTRLKTFLTLGRTTGINNAFAVIHNGQRYVVLDTKSGPFAPEHFLVVGHEVGHHICGHTLGMMRQNPLAMELEADRISGVALRVFVKTGGTITQAIAAARRFYADTQGSTTHPPQNQRIAAIMEGYETGTSPCFGRNVVMPGDPTKEEGERLMKERECRDWASWFCGAIKIHGTNDRRRLDEALNYNHLRAVCGSAGFKLPEYVLGPVQASGYKSISYPGIDCNGKLPRLVPQ